MATLNVDNQDLIKSPTRCREIISLRQLFETEGTLCVVGGNTPFLVDDQDSVWYIRTGKVEIFSVPVENGKPTGTRRHFFSAIAGQALFGMNIAKYGQGLGLLAVGMHNTQLFKLKMNRLEEFLTNPDFKSEISKLIDHWVSGLSLGLSRNIELRTDVMIEAGTDYHVKEGKKIRSKQGILWVQCSQGNPLFIGMEKITLKTPEVLFPLSHYTWLQMVSDTTIAAINTDAAITQGACWRGLEIFYELIFKCEFINTRLLAVDEFNLSQQRITFNRKIGENALYQLASVLEGRSETIPAIEIEDPLLAACRVVGNAMGLSIKSPPKPKENSKRYDSFHEIMRASQIRTRQVILKDNWWTKDNGPLLGFLVEDKAPIALLPVTAQRYELFNPMSGTKEPVTEDNVSEIAPQGYMFYRPFSDKIIDVKEMLKFSVQDCKNELVIIPLMGAAGGLVGMLIPILIGAIFSTVIPGADRSQLLQITIALLIGSLAAASFQVMRSIAVLRLEGKMAASVQAAVWDRLMKLPIPFFRQFTSGELATRAMGIDTIRQFLSGITVTTILGSIFSIFNFLLLFYYSWKLALAATGIVLIASSITIIIGYLQLKYLRPLNNLNNKISGELFQFITAISKIRIAGAEIRSYVAWAKKFTQQKRLAFKTRLLSNHIVVFNSVLPIIASMIIFATFAFYLGASRLSTGAYLAFNAAFIVFLTAALELSSTLISMLRIIPIYESAQPILKALPEVDISKSDPGELYGTIEISHVSFRYKADGPLILNDISVEINPGEFIALVGPSGSGKSTLLRLLLGFEVPETGSILYDGQDLSTLDITTVRRQIGAVLQNGKLMSGDIFTNIVGNAPLTIDNAWEAARMAGLDEDIKQMPMGMHTIVSEGGSTFSGGQRQRLLIARAIVRKPKIIFFDEATSALDNRTQGIVSKSLESLQATRIAIAHRLSTVINANRIYVIKAGKIVEHGSYHELMALNGTFAEIAKRQIV